MSCSIQLSSGERKTLLDYYRGAADPSLRLRAHIILLLAEGYTWALIGTVLFCSSRTIDRWHKRFAKQGLAGLWGTAAGAPRRYGAYWVGLVTGWFCQHLPTDFGFFRSRWSCALAVLLLWQDHRLRVSQETVRRWLHQSELVWRRPRPVLKRQDPKRGRILQALRQLLRELPQDQTVVFMDEVDINLNPEIGFMWMKRGKQAEVVTPGVNAKNYLAGSLNWRSGTLLAPVTGTRRNGQLVAEHLEELCRRLRCYKVIHVIWDNAKIHDCAAVHEVLAKHADRLKVHFLPRYAPECNPVERVWWRLREEITRNHQCQSLENLIERVIEWLDGSYFVVEDSVYRPKAKNQPKAMAA